MRALLQTSVTEEADKLLANLFTFFSSYKNDEERKKELGQYLEDYFRGFTVSLLKNIYEKGVAEKALTPINHSLNFCYLCTEVQLMFLALRKKKASRYYME